MNMVGLYKGVAIHFNSLFTLSKFRSASLNRDVERHGKFFGNFEFLDALFGVWDPVLGIWDGFDQFFSTEMLVPRKPLQQPVKRLFRIFSHDNNNACNNCEDNGMCS